MTLLGYDWSQTWMALQKIGICYLISLPIGWDREREAHTAGIRTFPIVAMASCGYLLLMSNGSSADQSRLLQGMIAGIGFIGGGAILKEGMTVKGTATAASIWGTAVVGAAVAMGRIDVAIVLSALNLFTLRALLPLKNRIDR